jgi:probable HAF family extracellular repeat protein
VNSVNINGLACGSITLGNGNTHAAVWQVGGTITDLDPTGIYSVATSITDSGTVVGYRDFGGGAYHAFKYSQGQMTDLHSLVTGGSYTYSYAWGINNQGEICGQMFTTTPSVVNKGFYLDKNNNVTRLDSFGGSFIAAYGINDSSLVVGESDTTGLEQAFKWLPGYDGPVDLASYFAIPNQVATSVNAQGDIAGYTALGYNVWAFVIQNGVFKDLSSGYVDTWVNGLNSKGQIVGSWYGGYGDDSALLWQGNQHYDLNSLLPAGSGWVLKDAVAINENGLVVGNGSYQGGARAFATMAPTTYIGPDTVTYTASDGISTATATVTVNVVDPNLDTDRNGLPDWWEMKYFHHLGVNLNDDPDGDGLTNYVEYLIGTNPLVSGIIGGSGGFINLQLYVPVPNF